jgi:hypothetical protein
MIGFSEALGLNELLPAGFPIRLESFSSSAEYIEKLDWLPAKNATFPSSCRWHTMAIAPLKELAQDGVERTPQHPYPLRFRS